MPANPRAHRATLEEIYSQAWDGRLDQADAAELVSTRARLAARQLEMRLVTMPQLELDDLEPRLAALMDIHPQTPQEGVRLECARVQLNALDEEVERRKAVAEAVQRGEQAAPSRTELLATMMGAINSLERDASESRYHEMFQQVVRACEDAQESMPGGIPRLTAALTKVLELTDAVSTDDIDPWLRTLLVLQLFSDVRRGVAGVTMDDDPATVAESNRARAIFLATERQDPRYRGTDWPLDIGPDKLHNVLDQFHWADRRWHQLGIPDTDRDEYTSFVRGEEIGRPEPHPQIMPEAEAREWAERAGGVVAPFVFAVPPRDRVRFAAYVWKHGLPDVAEGEQGMPLYSAAGDPRVRWGAGIYPYGIMCAVAIPSKRILTIGREEDEENDKLWSALTLRAESQSRNDEERAEVLRNLLMAHGYAALARYDYLTEKTPQPQELVIFEPSMENVALIRESVPSFMQGERELTIPQRKVGRSRVSRIA